MAEVEADVKIVFLANQAETDFSRYTMI